MCRQNRFRKQLEGTILLECCHCIVNGLNNIFALIAIIPSSVTAAVALSVGVVAGHLSLKPLVSTVNSISSARVTLRVALVLASRKERILAGRNERLDLTVAEAIRTL